jgi:cobalt-zinc-cadmium resistance protein CzcA
MLERLLRLSVAHRWFVVLAAIALAAIGANSLLRLPIDAIPDITNRQVVINTLDASLSPTEVEKQVTFVVETALAGIPGLSYTRSLSRNGFSQVTAVFGDDVDIYFARQQVLERLGAARESLPPTAEPLLGPITTGLGEIYMWTVEYEHPRGEGAPHAAGLPGWQPDGSYLTPEGEPLRSEFEQLVYLRTLQDWLIRPQIKSVPGVAGVDAIGGYVKQYHVQPDPRRLAAYGLTFQDLIEALERNNLSTGAGYVEHQGEAYIVRAAARLAGATELASIVVASQNGTPILLRNVASVGIGRELRTGTATEDGSEVVLATALMLVGENSRSVATAVDEKLEEIGRSLPPGIRTQTVLDRTALVDATIRTVEKNLLEGALLVVAVLFVMLGNLRAALVTALAIPLSMLLTAIGMAQTRTSGNLMSLGAIDFGLIVDGAVIVVENCLRLLAEKQHEIGRALRLDERARVVTQASSEVLAPASMGGLIIIVVYVPILFLTGVEGKMFEPMARTVIFALTAAFLLAFTFVPALVVLVVRAPVHERPSRVVEIAKRAYAPALRAALRFRHLTVIAAALLFAASLALFARLGQEFAPTLSELDILVQPVRIPSTSLTSATTLQRDLERVLEGFPEVAFVFSRTGTAEIAVDPMPFYVSDTFIVLKPRTEWPDPGETKEDIRERIEGAVQTVPGSNYEFTQPIQMRFNELLAGVRGDLAIKVFGDEFEALIPTAERIEAVLRTIEGATDIRVEQVRGAPVLSIDVDRSSLARYGLSAADVHEVAAIAIGGRRAGQLFEGDRRFDIVVRLPEAFREDMTALERLPIPLAAGANGEREEETAKQPMRVQTVPLGSVAALRIAEGPNQISRENGKRRIVVQANVRGRDIASFVAEAQERIASHVKLPPGTWLEWGGQFKNLEEAKARLTIVIPICFVLIFLLLFSTFGNGKDAVLVFTAVPLALTGGVVSLWLRGMPFSISAAVGFIALSGVAVLNGLVMLSFINQLRAQGHALEEAVTTGALTRLRPVLMTALVASLGFVPMALATGTGAEVQRPLATVVIGGLVSSTLLTLLVLPALYSLATRESTTDDANGPDADGGRNA